jgi:hypothetical protein
MDPSKNNIAFTLAYDCIFNSQTVEVSLYKIVYIDEKVIYNISYTDNDKKYICPTGSIKSHIGNYRNGMIDVSTFRAFLAKNDSVKELFERILTYVKDREGERKFDFEVEYIKQPSRKKASRDSSTVDNTAAQFTYAIALFTFYYNYLSNEITTDFNPDYKRIMITYQDEDRKVFKDIKKHKDATTLYFACTGTLETKHKIGQKLTMLTLSESQNLFDPNSMLWKELYIQFKLSDLVVNGISNGFALISSWFIIDNEHTHKLFDGVRQLGRIRNSKLAEGVVKVLSNAKLRMKEIDREVGSYYREINDKMHVLDTRINNDVKYAKENIILSNVVLTTIMQDLGNTFFNTVINTQNMFSRSNSAEFDKYMFELCYNLYCLNTKVYAIHGDLHLNNLIISDTCERDSTNIVFQIEDEKYVFPNTSKKHLCIIDFGHTICNAEHVSSFRQVHDRDKFLSTQIDDLLRYLYSIYKDYKDHNDVFRKKLQYHYWAFFKILTALDIYIVTTGISSMMKHHKGIGSVSREASDLVHDIKKSCDYYLINYVELLLGMSDYSTIEEVPWPNIDIIKKHFAKYKSTKISTGAIVINYNKKVVHSLYKQTQFPPKFIKQATKEQTKQRKKYDIDTEMMFGSIK